MNRESKKATGRDTPSSCPQFVIAYWAILMAGAIVVNLNPLYTREELKFLFNDAGLSGLFTYDALIPVS